MTNRSRVLLASCLAAGAALFVVGGRVHAAATGTRATETVLGVDMGAAAVLAGVVASSALLAVVALVTNSTVAVGAACVFAATAVVFDAARIVHQVDQSRSGAAAIAGALAVVHLGALAAGTARLVAPAITPGGDAPST